MYPRLLTDKERELVTRYLEGSELSKTEKRALVVLRYRLEKSYERIASDYELIQNFLEAYWLVQYFKRIRTMPKKYFQPERLALAHMKLIRALKEEGKVERKNFTRSKGGTEVDGLGI